ncbi:MAG: hypothetical protein RQ731_05330 [Anaerosomatales bacterium]|nr:hypothetical protein [Anaerosomatales bacterium]
MSGRTFSEKARIKPGTRIALINSIPDVIESLHMPDVTFIEPADAESVFLFVRQRAELEDSLPAAAATLVPGVTLWVFFRKGSSSAGLDMNRDTIWASAETMGMRPVGLLSVDDAWSAFRLKLAPHPGP